MLRLSNLDLRRGTRELLHDARLTLHPGQRLGLTGANGVGKSSLLALIRGELTPDAGTVELPPNTVIAHVAQETPTTTRPAVEHVIDGDRALRRLQDDIARAEQADDGERLSRLYADLEAIDGYTAGNRAARLLHGLGFGAEEVELPVASFSGGWRMRLNLAQALMCRSDLLLLDEPTNHLDLEAVVWLDDWLRAYRGMLLLISHDREFLDDVTTHIAHIEHGRLTQHPGNYTSFERRRAEQLAAQQAMYERQQREIARVQGFVERFRAKATKASQAQSRLKALERMRSIGPAHVDSPFRFGFRPPERLPEHLLTLENAAAGYDDHRVLAGLHLRIDAGDRIGLLGPNGAGKSTLIRLVAGDLLPCQGERSASRHLRIGYFAQHQLEQLDLAATALLHLRRLDPEATEQSLQDFLGGFGFGKDLASRSVDHCSGGEKARLVLALIAYQRPNLLLLDEPTNHLDLEMRHALALALQDYAGAAIIVSHDRHLLRSAADRLLLLSNGTLQPFDGDLEDYRRWLGRQGQGDEADSSPQGGAKAADARRQQRRDAAEQRRRERPLREQLQALESRAGSLAEEQRQLRAALADGTLYESTPGQELGDLIRRESEVTRRLQETEEEWLVASERLESMNPAG